MSNAMVSTAPLRQVKDVRELLSNTNARGQLASVAASHMNPERMMRVVANAIRSTPKLQEADPLSMLGALMNCAAMGLEPNTQLGHAYLVPFNNRRKGLVEVQVIIGYKGFIDLARRSGSLVSIHADVVYTDDVKFTAEYGSNQHLSHIPGPRKGAREGAYCHIKLKNGDSIGEGHVYMTADEILAVRDRSQGWLSAKSFGKTAENPWSTHPDRMWSKTAVRRIANSGELPMSIEFLQAMETDDTHVDYASYALNPEEGMIIDGETGEIVEDTSAGAKEIEKTGPQPKLGAEQEKVITTNTAARSDGKARGKDQGAVNPDVWEAFRNTVIKDLVESGEPDEIANFYAERMEEAKAVAPAIYNEIVGEIDKMRGAKAGGQAAMNV